MGDPARPDLTARWVEVDIAFAGLTPQVAAVRAGGVRLRGSLHDGVLKLGDLDQFRDPNSTAPFSLPDIKVALNDARMTLDTDAGPVGMEMDGAGNLQSGFRGRLAAAMRTGRVPAATTRSLGRRPRPRYRGSSGSPSTACQRPDGRTLPTIGSPFLNCSM